METLKEEAMNAIDKLPETANVDEIMYRISNAEVIIQEWIETAEKRKRPIPEP